jgi:hypothetical protein
MPGRNFLHFKTIIVPFQPKCPKLQSFSMNKVNEKKSNPWAASLWRKGLNLALTKLPMREKGIWNTQPGYPRKKMIWKSQISCPLDQLSLGKKTFFGRTGLSDNLNQVV